MEQKKNLQAYYALLRGGLWEKDVRLLPFGEIDFAEVYKLAEEQSVIGLVAAGLEHVADVKIPQNALLQFIGQTLQLEERNKAMNSFIGVLVEELRKAGIIALLVKGQGVAKCYERPLWRASGDVDFYLSRDNFIKAKSFLKPQAKSIDPDNDFSQHINIRYDTWVIELHGNQKGSLSPRINRGMDVIHRRIFDEWDVRSIQLGGTTVCLPSPDNDVIIIFNHFVNHFYKGGLGVRQICDWCRLIWVYKDSINRKQLERTIRQMGYLRIWKAFAVFAVDYLGMPAEAMPMYSNEVKWRRKARRINSFIIEVGNFGHNRKITYYGKYPKLICKTISMWRRFSDTIRHTLVFPFDSLRFFPNEVYYGIRAALNGE